MSIEMIFTTVFNLLICSVMVVYVRKLVKRETNTSTPAIHSAQPIMHQFMAHSKRAIFRTVFVTLLMAVIGFSLLPTSVRAQVSSWVAVGNGDTKYMDGNVGIGRAPYAGVRLHVDGGDAWIWNNGNNPGILIGDNANSGNWGSIRWNSTDKALEIGHQADTDLLTLDNRVNIGGHVNIQDANGAAVINFPATGTYPNLYIRSDDDPDTYEFSSERLFVGGDGDIGIGTTDPLAKLDINGGLVTANGINAGGNPGSALMWKVIDYEETGVPSGTHYVATGIDFDKVVSFTCQRVLTGNTMWDQSLAEDQFDDSCTLYGSQIIYDLGNKPSFEDDGHVHFKAVIQYQE